MEIGFTERVLVHPRGILRLGARIEGPEEASEFCQTQVGAGIQWRLRYRPTRQICDRRPKRLLDITRAIGEQSLRIRPTAVFSKRPVMVCLKDEDSRRTIQPGRIVIASTATFEVEGDFVEWPRRQPCPRTRTSHAPTQFSSWEYNGKRIYRRRFFADDLTDSVIYAEEDKVRRIPLSRFGIKKASKLLSLKRREFTLSSVDKASSLWNEVTQVRMFGLTRFHLTRTSSQKEFSEATANGRRKTADSHFAESRRGWHDRSHQHRRDTSVSPC